MHASTTLRRRPVRAAVTSTLLCAALVAGGAGAAQAHDRDRDRDHHHHDVPEAGDQKTLADGLVGPLSLAVGSKDTVLVSQNFGGTIEQVGRKGSRTTVVTAAGPQEELGSLSARDRGFVYTTSVGAGTADFDSHLLARDRKGHVRHLADLGGYERSANPDGDVAYGFGPDLDPACATELPDEVPASYTGGLDSHPYATAVYRGSVLVADAGANAVLAVDKRGRVSTVAVLPPTPLTVTTDVAAVFGMPTCTVGKVYGLEPVPTDVEVGRDGWLYVTSLPGGPEAPGAVPPSGAVYKVNPWSGAVRLVAGGLTSATNLAIGDEGEIYVTELFANRVSVIPRGSSTAQPFLELTLPAAVEVEDDDLYVTTEALPSETAPPSGKVIKVELDD